MKSKYLIIALALLATCLSCDKSEFPAKDFSVDDINYGECKPMTKSVLEQYLLLSTTEDFYLSINHINAMFNCVPGQIIVDATLEENIITINEYSTENSANCICPYDLSFKIGPIKYDTYILSMNQANYEVLNVEIEFNDNTDLRIDIENAN
jgi:hypothetical protein